ncbi:MAG: hypothetical protein WC458_03450 [Patescibacteria group bacterium]
MEKIKKLLGEIIGDLRDFIIGYSILFFIMITTSATLVFIINMNYALLQTGPHFNTIIWSGIMATTAAVIVFFALMSAPFADKWEIFIKLLFTFILVFIACTFSGWCGSIIM